MKKPTKPTYLTKETLRTTELKNSKQLDEKEIIGCAEKLRRVLMDPNQVPVMEIFIELE